MKKLTVLLLTVICLCSSCQTKGISSSAQKEEADSAAIYQEMAYEEMFADSLLKAEQYAYRDVFGVGHGRATWVRERESRR